MFVSLRWVFIFDFFWVSNLNCTVCEQLLFFSWNWDNIEEKAVGHQLSFVTGPWKDSQLYQFRIYFETNSEITNHTDHKNVLRWHWWRGRVTFDRQFLLLQVCSHKAGKVFIFGSFHGNVGSPEWKQKYLKGDVKKKAWFKCDWSLCFSKSRK